MTAGGLCSSAVRTRAHRAAEAAAGAVDGGAGVHGGAVGYTNEKVTVAAMVMVLRLEWS